MQKKLKQESNERWIRSKNGILVWILSVPKCPCVKLGPQCGPIGRWWKLEELGSPRRLLGHEPVLSNVLVGLWCLPLSFTLVSKLWCGWFYSATHSHHNVLPCHRLKGNRANQLWNEASKSMSQNQCFLFINWLCQAFVIATESWQTQGVVRAWIGSS